MQTEEQNHFFRARRVLAVILSMAVLLTLLCPLMARAEEPEQKTVRVGYVNSIDYEEGGDGEEAVGLFRNHPAGTFDVILMDIMMPRMNGREAAKNIRNMADRPDGKTIPIIAMTANAFAEDVQSSLDAGMNAHLSKPIVMDEVVKTIARNLSR